MKWKLLKPEGATIYARHGHRAVAVDDGVLIYGGGNRGICKWKFWIQKFSLNFIFTGNQMHIYNIFQNKNILPMFSGKICPGIAAFGMVNINNKLIIFGGMFEYQIYTNQLYTLDMNDWHWTKITNAIGEPPRARIGHSFTAIDEHKILVFGGIINVHRNPEKHLNPRFTNDLFILHSYPKNKFAWEEIIVANGPIGRESHSAVFYHNKIQNKQFLVIFGGMNGERLNDLWFLDVDDFVWMQFDTLGSPPKPRSLHTASLVGSQMFVFGGWINQDDDESADDKENMSYCSTNSMHILDLNTFEWKEVENSALVPPPRAGHCAVACNNRIYISSGRSIYRFIGENPAPCHDDFWFLELSLPLKITKLELIQCTTKSIEIKWNRVGNANCYVIEVRRVHDMTSSMISSLKLVKNVNQVSIADQRKADVSTAKKVIIINPMQNKIPQLDGCSEEFEETQGNDNVKQEVSHIRPSTNDKSWCTVGVFKNNTCTVNGYFEFTFSPDFNDDMCKQNVLMPKIELQVNTMYAFRVAGINSCGIGEFSNLGAFRTLPEGLPSHPNNLKFIPMNTSALRLCWTPSPLDENVKEYCVFIGEKQNDTINYNRVYTGNQPTCTISYDMLKKPEYQLISKENQSKFFLFRVRATNDKGMGPPLQAACNIGSEIMK